MKNKQPYGHSVTHRGGSTNLLPRAAVGMLPWLLVACGSTTYVGNSKFDLDELCSREYASKLGWFSGGAKCVPPAAASNVQSYFYDRYRMPVSLQELMQIEARQADNEAMRASTRNRQPHVPLNNPVPNLIGRVFVTHANEHDHKAWTPPAYGNLFFLETDVHHRAQLPVDLHNANRVQSIEQKNFKFGADLTAQALLDAALGGPGVANPLKDAAATADLYQSLLNATLQFGLSQASTDMGAGNYYYLSLTQDAMSQLTTHLERCDWIQRRPSGSYRQNTVEEVPYPISKDARKNDTVFKTCPLPAHGTSTPITHLLKNIESEYGSNSLVDRGIQHLGLITGVAVVRTQKAAHVTCNHFSAAINGHASDGASCQTLRDTLNQAMAASAKLKPTEPNLPAADELAKRISVAYNRATYKTLQMDDHGGVLAIQWLPLDVRHRP